MAPEANRYVTVFFRCIPLLTHRTPLSMRGHGLYGLQHAVAVCHHVATPAKLVQWWFGLGAKETLSCTHRNHIAAHVTRVSKIMHYDADMLSIHSLQSSSVAKSRWVGKLFLNKTRAARVLR